jgi:hypothetical protein|tara:strand:+ start:519 stop:722 length:204 start_codon:yes stop_codon:yes gene_type:complete
LEQRGVPTITVCTDRFRVLGEIERRSLGIPELPMAIAKHPFGGLKADAVETKADLLLEQVVAGLTTR